MDTTLDVRYAYDQAGHRLYRWDLSKIETTHYYWNDAGYLKQVDIDYGTGETPRYARAWLTWDPTGELVKLEVRTGPVLNELTPGSGGTLEYLTKWTYWGGTVLVERDEVPGTPEEKEYVSLPDAYLYQVDASSNYWYYHYDGDASVAAITDASKNIKALYEFDSFGNKLTNAGTVDNAFGFYGGTLIERLGLIPQLGPYLYDPKTADEVASSAAVHEGLAVGCLVVLLAAVCSAALTPTIASRSPFALQCKRFSVVLLTAVFVVTVVRGTDCDVVTIHRVDTERRWVKTGETIWYWYVGKILYFDIPIVGPTGETSAMGDPVGRASSLRVPCGICMCMWKQQHLTHFKKQVRHRMRKSWYSDNAAAWRGRGVAAQPYRSVYYWTDWEDFYAPSTLGLFGDMKLREDTDRVTSKWYAVQLYRSWGSDANDFTCSLKCKKFVSTFKDATEDPRPTSPWCNWQWIPCQESGPNGEPIPARR